MQQLKEINSPNSSRFRSENRRYLPHNCSHKDIKGIAVNVIQAFDS